jgi:hypothetical protein
MQLSACLDGYAGESIARPDLQGGEIGHRVSVPRGSPKQARDSLNVIVEARGRNNLNMFRYPLITGTREWLRGVNSRRTARIHAIYRATGPVRPTLAGRYDEVMAQSRSFQFPNASFLLTLKASGNMV